MNNFESPSETILLATLAAEERKRRYCQIFKLSFKCLLLVIVDCCYFYSSIVVLPYYMITQGPKEDWIPWVGFFFLLWVLSAPLVTAITIFELKDYIQYIKSLNSSKDLYDDAAEGLLDAKNKRTDLPV